MRCIRCNRPLIGEQIMIGKYAIGRVCAKIMGISKAVADKVAGKRSIKRKCKATDFDDMQEDFFGNENEKTKTNVLNKND